MRLSVERLRRLEDRYDPRQPQIKIPRKVIKGGSHLCAPNDCRRCRPAAPRGADRYVHESHRISMHQARSL
jgi:formylglycine-generating enzyme